jgi:hypothetical protein
MQNKRTVIVCQNIKKEVSTVKKHVLAIFLFLLAICISVVFYSQLPDVMPTHWGRDGKPDEFTHKQIATFIIPLVMAVSYSSFHFTMKYVYNKRSDDVRLAYFVITYAIIAFLFFIHILLILISLGVNLSFNACLLFAIGIFFIVLSLSFKMINFRDSIAFSFYQDPCILQKIQTYSIGTFRFIGIGILLSLLLSSHVRFYTTIGIIGGGTFSVFAVILYYYVTDNSS